ncbi:hypothetical protein DPMN_008495 [Dreissena polymorpha]|uniref:Uncharacterized protein n=1 Tax=Dreissena polymorpha TaxID=45954 RepID=A0A9D4MZF2_DREPO|nr:hypothetical protein DPMN_008495 [Dreissena polymorpha]
MQHKCGLYGQFAHLRGFHDDWAKNVTSRVFTSFFYYIMHFSSPVRTLYINMRKLPPPHFVRDINKTNVLTNFHDDWEKIVTSRVFTSHVIKLTGTISELNSHIKETNLVTKFNENWAKNVTSRVFTCFHYIHIEKNAPPTGGYVFSPIWTIFELVRDINKTNVLTNFHDDWAKIVTSRVFTRKTAPPTGGHIGHEIFELDQDFIGTKLLTKFHEDGTRNVASRVFTNKCGRTTDKDR